MFAIIADSIHLSRLEGDTTKFLLTPKYIQKQNSTELTKYWQIECNQTFANKLTFAWEKKAKLNFPPSLVNTFLQERNLTGRESLSNQFGKKNTRNCSLPLRPQFANFTFARSSTLQIIWFQILNFGWKSCQKIDPLNIIWSSKERT